MKNRSLTLMQRWDALVAAGLVGFAFVPGVERQGVDLANLPDRALDPLGWALIFIQGAGVALLRRWPSVSLALVGTAFAAYQLLAYVTTFAALGLLVVITAGGALVRHGRMPVIGITAACYVLLAVGLARRSSPTEFLDYVVFGSLLTLLWLAGAWLGGQAEAQKRRQAEAERTAVHQERSRLARELHDVVTHHVTAMVVQADAALYALNDSERISGALNVISVTGRTALTDLRGLLGALDGVANSSPRTPALADLEEVVASVRTAGVRVDLVEDGPPRIVDAAVALAITRVVQESLTNAMKHAPDASTRVLVQYCEREIQVTVTTYEVAVPDPGRTGGYGLIGLHERINLTGGSFQAGREGDHFVVHATVPA